MNKNIGLIVGGIVVAVIAISAFSSGGDSKEMVKEKMAQPAAMENKEAMMPEKEMMKKESGTMMDDQKPMMKKAGSYEAYAPEKLMAAATGDVVLFFHAAWCPSCRSLSADIEKNMASIPEGLTILKVDYDDSTEMKKKYGVTSQHTLVQVAADGTLIKKWSGSANLGAVVSQVN